MIAIVVPAHGTVVLRDDGSVSIVDRGRAQYLLDPAIVQAIGRLLNGSDDVSARDDLPAA